MLSSISSLRSSKREAQSTKRNAAVRLRRDRLAAKRHRRVARCALSVALPFCALPACAQINTVRISEILADPAGSNEMQAIELFNAGPAAVSLNGAAIASGDQVVTLSGLADVPPGGTVVIQWNQDGSSSGNQLFTGATFELDPAEGNLALFKSSQVTRAGEMVAFVQWGAPNQTRADLAAQAALWDAASFVQPAAEGQAMALLPGGSGRGTAEWAALAPTIGAPNAAPAAGFSGWALVGGQSIKAPAAAFPSGGDVLELVSMAPGGTVQHHRYSNGAWSTVPGPAGTLTQPPALVAGSGGTLELVAVGTDNKTYHSRFEGGQWSSFTVIAEQTTTLPATLAYDATANTAELVIVGADNQLLHSRLDNGQWSAFAPVGDQSGAAPALVFNAQGNTLELLFSALSQTVCHTQFQGSSWVPPSSTDGQSALTPAVVALPDGTLDAAITSPDGSVLQNRFANGAWRGWQPIAGLQSDQPPTLIFSPESSTTELFAVGRDRQVRQARRTGDTWSAAAAIGAVAAFPPAAVPSTGGLVEVVITGQDGNLWHTRFQAKPAAATPEISFAKEIQPIFTASCARSGCHGGSRPAEDMDLSEGQAFDNIVAVPSNEAPDLNRIEPGDPDKSYLLHKLRGTQRSAGGSGSRMPLGGRALADDQIARIRQWIEQGAKNN
jgi:Lamin Tail Domain